MKNIKLLFSLLVLFVLCGTQYLRAQDVTSISDLRVFDRGDGSGYVQVIISGPDAETVEPGTITLNGARIDGGRFSTTIKVAALKPGTAVMVAPIPMRELPESASTNLHYAVKVSYRLEKIVRQHLEEVGMTKSEFAR